MQPDTLILVICITAAIMGGSLFALYLASREHRCLRDWSLAGAFFCSYALLSLLAAPLAEWGQARIALSNALLVCGHAAMWIGLRRLLGLAPGWPMLALLVVLLLALHALPWMQASAARRLLLLWPLLIALNLGVALQAARSAGFGWRSPLLPLALLALLNAAQMGWRMGLALDWQTGHLQLAQDAPTRSLGLLLLFLNILLGAMACAFVVIRSQALQLRAVAETDTLTGWLNRRRLDAAMAAAQARSRRFGQPFGLLLFDIDHFKRINDGHGHAVGDQALARVAACVAVALREVDLCFRIGGEEFLVLLPPESTPHLATVAERLRQAVASQALPLSGGKPLNMTVSVGAALLRLPDEAWEETLRRADAALYAAKQGGRNRCVLADAAPQA